MGFWKTLMSYVADQPERVRGPMNNSTESEYDRLVLFQREELARTVIDLKNDVRHLESERADWAAERDELWAELVRARKTIRDAGR